jgi:hypothetical protein
VGYTERKIEFRLGQSVAAYAAGIRFLFFLLLSLLILVPLMIAGGLVLVYVVGRSREGE